MVCLVYALQMQNPARGDTMKDLIKFDSSVIKTKISTMVPNGTKVSKAAKIMEGIGFKCKITRQVKFASDNPSGGSQLIHGPSDTLWCDSGEVGGLMMATRLQVTFLLGSQDRVLEIFIAKGFTGP